MTTSPKAVLVLDVNVFIDAVNPRSIRRAAAQATLTTNHDMPIYVSDTMLETTAIKMLELGASPQVLREYLDLLVVDQDFDHQLQVLENVPIKNHGLLDKYGHEDYEDSTVVSLMDAAEADAEIPAVLVSSDGALRDWCTDNHRVAVRPDHLGRFAKGDHNTFDKAALGYVARRAFETPQAPVSTDDAKRQGVALVDEVLQRRYRRFPELQPQSDTQAEPVPEGLER